MKCDPRGAVFRGASAQDDDRLDDAGVVAAHQVQAFVDAVPPVKDVGDEGCGVELSVLDE